MKGAKKQRPIDLIDHRICWHGVEDGDTTLSCHRTALPKRLLCGKHAGQKNAILARRRRRKARRRTIQVARRRVA